MFSRNEINNPHATPSRRFHPWTAMEEYLPDGGMWAIINDSDTRARLAGAAADVMADPERFAESMRRALREWPRSVEVALTTPGMNHRAWLGHAGCFLAVGSPEDVTRIGWHQLDDGEQYAANAAADTVIREWRLQQDCVMEPLPLGDWDA